VRDDIVASAYPGKLRRLRRGSRLLGAEVLARPATAWARRAPELGEPLLASAPEILDVVVCPARQVGGDPRPLVPELRLQVQHHPLFLGRELAAPVAERSYISALPL
jgi:hypothetical protein